MKATILLLLSAFTVFGQASEPEVNQPKATQPKVIQPRVRYKIDPEYTRQAARKKIQGLVALRCVVSAEGLPTEITVQRSLDPGLDDNAVAALKHWIWWPATKDGKPVAMRATIDFSFHVKERQ